MSQTEEAENFEAKYEEMPEPTKKQKASIVILIAIMYGVMLFLVYLLAIHAIAVAPA
ncbi:MAG: hypothetical protein M1431_01380 [Candidatus Thermoplasmatota archaeon]|nr:hypothetical protein [Candidatus Thermoplasmatota archaeon]